MVVEIMDQSTAVSFAIVVVGCVFEAIRWVFASLYVASFECAVICRWWWRCRWRMVVVVVWWR